MYEQVVAFAQQLQLIQKQLSFKELCIYVNRASYSELHFNLLDGFTPR